MFICLKLNLPTNRVRGSSERAQNETSPTSSHNDLIQGSFGFNIYILCPADISESQLAHRRRDSFASVNNSRSHHDENMG